MNTEELMSELGGVADILRNLRKDGGRGWVPAVAEPLRRIEGEVRALILALDE